MTYNRHEHARHRLGDLIHGDNSPESDAINAGYSTAHDLHQNFCNDIETIPSIDRELALIERAIDPDAPPRSP